MTSMVRYKEEGDISLLALHHHRPSYPNYPLLAKPLYEATKWGEQEPMVWGEEQEKAFKEIKREIKNTPVLGLPDVMKPFFLYVHRRWDSCRSLDPVARFLAPPSGLFIKAT
jgi:hypothetical protein